MAAIIVLVGASTVLAAGVAPRVGVDPEGDLAVKLEVGTAFGDSSWIWLPFASPIDVAEHPVVSVSYDIYRYDYGPPPEIFTQNLFWSWVDEEDGMISMTPSWGAQWDLSRTTFPFGWFAPGANQVPTVFGRYASIDMLWDFENMEAFSWYDGVLVDGAYPITQPAELLYGYDITLLQGSGDGRGPDAVWIDNFVITGSDIYNSDGFEGFNIGGVNGQDGWVAGTEQGTGPEPIPEPCTLALLGLGLAGTAVVRRTRKHR